MVVRSELSSFPTVNNDRDQDGSIQTVMTDTDDDGDGKNDTTDQCPTWNHVTTRNSTTDYDDDGCNDASEDFNDDNDNDEDYANEDDVFDNVATSNYTGEFGCPDDDGDGRQHRRSVPRPIHPSGKIPIVTGTATTAMNSRWMQHKMPIPTATGTATTVTEIRAMLVLQPQETPRLTGLADVDS